MISLKKGKIDFGMILEIQQTFSKTFLEKNLNEWNEIGVYFYD